MNILNIIDNEINVITTDELPNNLKNIASLNSDMKTFMKLFVNKHPNLFAQYLILGQTGGGTSENAKNISDIMNIYSSIDFEDIKQRVDTINSVSDYLKKQLQKKKDQLNKDNMLLDTDAKIINATKVLNDAIQNAQRYNTFDFKSEHIQDIIYDYDGSRTTESYYNYLMDPDNFFIINKLNALQHAANYPLLTNGNINKVHIDKTDINVDILNTYIKADNKYKELIAEYSHHIKSVISINKSGRHRLHIFMNKQLLDRYNSIASKIKNLPSIYAKIPIMIDTIINFTASLSKVIGDKTLNMQKISTNSDNIKQSLSYGVNLINCLNMFINSLTLQRY